MIEGCFFFGKDNIVFLKIVKQGVKRNIVFRQFGAFKLVHFRDAGGKRGDSVVYALIFFHIDRCAGHWAMYGRQVFY